MKGYANYLEQQNPATFSKLSHSHLINVLIYRNTSLHLTVHEASHVIKRGATAEGPAHLFPITLTRKDGQSPLCGPCGNGDNAGVERQGAVPEEGQRGGTPDVRGGSGLYMWSWVPGGAEATPLGPKLHLQEFPPQKCESPLPPSPHRDLWLAKLKLARSLVRTHHVTDKGPGPHTSSQGQPPCA